MTVVMGELGVWYGCRCESWVNLDVQHGSRDCFVMMEFSEVSLQKGHGDKVEQYYMPDW